MTQDFVIHNCIAWNATEMRKAANDALDRNVRVPFNMKKRQGAQYVQLTPDEYRAVRTKDASRHVGNIASLEAML